MKTSVLLYFLLVFLIPISNYAQVIYVDESATGTNDGLSWQNAYSDLQDALDNVSAGDTIWIAEGVYKPSVSPDKNNADSRNNTFVLKDEIAIYGGFKGNEESLDERKSPELYTSYLSGDIGANGNKGENTYHVLLGVNLSGQVTIDGFTVVGGNANGNSTISVDNEIIEQFFGGGIYLRNSDVKMKNIRIKENTARTGGAGINNVNGSPSIENSQFENNKVTGDDVDPDEKGGGAGMRNILEVSSSSSVVPIIKDTEFTGNIAEDVQGGGAMRNIRSAPEFERVLFHENKAVNVEDGGGAIYNVDSDGIINNVVFTKNTTTAEGGAMYNDGSSPKITNAQFIENSSDAVSGAMENDAQSNVVIDRVLFKNNKSKNDGGAMHNWKSSPIITNSVFEGNETEANGGAISIYTQSAIRITNTTFIANQAEGNGGAIYILREAEPVITNALFTQNHANESGGALYVDVYNDTVGSNPILTNVTISNNSAGVSAGGWFDVGEGGTRIRNTIIAGNHAPNDKDIEIPPAMLDTSFFYTIIDEEYFEGGVNSPISFTDPIFKDTIANDYRLADNSMAIDNGDSTYFDVSKTPDLSEIKTDITGADRIMGSEIDLGAYEYCTVVVTPFIEISSTPDLSDTEVALETPVTFEAIISGGGLNPIYKWYKNEALIDNENDEFYSGIVGTDFEDGDKIHAELTSSLSCADYQTVKSNEIEINVDDMSVDDFLFDKKQVLLYPNPSNGKFTLEISGKTNQSYEVFIRDMQGRELYYGSMTNQLRKEFDFSGTLNVGVYFLTIYSDSGHKKVNRLIIK